MSVANLIKLLVCGRYPYAYVLRTATLADAEKDGGVFEGAVGSPREDGNGGGFMDLSDPPFWVKRFLIPSLTPFGDYRGYWWIVPIIGILIFLIAIISQPLFVFLLSGFKARRNTRGLIIWTPKAGQSTRAQRIWMLGWLVVNVCSGPRAHFVASGRGGERGRGRGRVCERERLSEGVIERGDERGDERFNWVSWADFWLDYVFFSLHMSLHLGVS